MNRSWHVSNDRDHLNNEGRYAKRSRSLFTLIIMMLFIAACSSSWEPSDTDAVNLVKNYYLFYSGGKEIDAEIIERGAYIKKCKCFPVKFKITGEANESYEKTFYFFKNKSGKVDLSEFQIHN